jgi:hypothetical protein
MRRHPTTYDERCPGGRSTWAKLLDRPDLLDRLRRLVHGRIAYVEL